jgi:transposase
MDHRIYEPFFLQPADTWHRRYEALRSVVVERQPLSEVADRFGISHGTIRNWVSAFCAQCDGGKPPPFSLNHPAGVLRAGTIRPMGRRSKWRTSKRCRWRWAVAYGPE